MNTRKADERERLIQWIDKTITLQCHTLGYAGFQARGAKSAAHLEAQLLRYRRELVAERRKD